MKHETKKLYDAAYKIIIIIIIMIGGLSSFCDLKTKIREKPFRISQNSFKEISPRNSKCNYR